jgi:hypothetical protein
MKVFYEAEACTQSSGAVLAFGDSVAAANASFSGGGTPIGRCQSNDTDAGAPIVYSAARNVPLSAAQTYVLLVVGLNGADGTATDPRSCDLEHPQASPCCVILRWVVDKPHTDDAFAFDVTVTSKCACVACDAGQVCGLANGEGIPTTNGPCVNNEIICARDEGPPYCDYLASMH